MFKDPRNFIEADFNLLKKSEYNLMSLTTSEKSEGPLAKELDLAVKDGIELVSLERLCEFQPGVTKIKKEDLQSDPEITIPCSNANEFKQSLKLTRKY